MLVDATPTKKTYAGLFCVTLATLMYEITLTRIFSVTMWYHFAFVAISLAMFGLSAGAVIVYLFPRWFTPERTRQHLARSAMLFAASAVVSSMAHLSIPVLMERSLLGFASVAFTYAVIAVPFVCSGVCVCLALTRFPRHVGRLYAADLAGAAVACILLLLTLEVTDAPATVLFVAFWASLAAVLFSGETQAAKLKRMAWLYTLLFLGVAGMQTVRAWEGRPIFRLRWAKGEPERIPLYERWNSFSRIRVYGNPQRARPPFGWGLSATYPPDRKIRQLALDIDADALTVLTFFDGKFEPLDFLKYDVTNIAYYLRDRGRVLVVGAGGGRDILSALVFGQKSVVAVELNENILEAVNGEFGNFTGHLDRIPGVTFVADEARSYIARSPERFDVIQVSMIDTWAATAAGAFVLAERSLYTVEAWKIFLDHLDTRGLLTISRWSVGDRPAEVYRLLSLAGASLRSAGVSRPRDHLVVVRHMRPRLQRGVAVGVATLLASKEPFSAQDLDTLEEVSRRMQFEVVLSPRAALDPAFAALASGEGQPQLSTSFSLNLAPPTDDSPFFFQMLRMRDILNRQAWQIPDVAFNLKAVFLLAALLATVIGLTLLCILLPLWLKSGAESRRGASALFVFFAAIGLGFMLVEISQLERLLVFLGHPSYALSVVLFALLLSSGLGSYLAERMADASARGAGALPLLALVGLLLLFGAVTPALLGAFQASATPVRIGIAIAMLFPLGLFMGTAFPLGMRVASTRCSTLTPWLWGLNGGTSVCGSVLAVVIAISAGISASFWTGVASYGVAVLAFLASSRKAVPPGPAPDAALRR